jgi:hypothetical protein
MLAHCTLRRPIPLVIANKERCGAQVTALQVAEQERAEVATEKFDFGQYMNSRAEMVNSALDGAVPLQYPEVINESMRYDSPSLPWRFPTPGETGPHHFLVVDLKLRKPCYLAGITHCISIPIHFSTSAPHSYPLFTFSRGLGVAWWLGFATCGFWFRVCHMPNWPPFLPPTILSLVVDSLHLAAQVG